MKQKKVLGMLLVVVMMMTTLGMSALAADTAAAGAAPAGAGAGAPGGAGGPGGPGMPGGSSGITTSADLIDFSSITHQEAVSMMVKLGLVSGIKQADDKYAYEPAKSIDRAAMSKIIALATTLVRKSETMAVKDTASYKDIAGNWAEKYIEFCTTKNIIAGKGAGKYDPAGTVTGLETAKMLLAAMGDTTLAGSNWAELTAAAAKKAGLYEGISADMSKAISRDDAAQMIYNALKASDGKMTLPGLVVIKETISATEYTIAGNTLYTAPEGKGLSMTVDGVETRMSEGTYKGAIVLASTNTYAVSNMGSNYNLRMGAFINDGKYDKASSVESTLLAGTVTDTAATDVKMDSQNDSFNTIVVAGNSKYSIVNPVITLNGHGLNDFAGQAAGIMTTGNADVTIENANINTTGAIRTGIWAGGNSKLLVKNSTIIGKDGTDLNFKAGMLKEVPWVLGLKGNLRATNVLGSAQATYLNCYVAAENWGALSTDSTADGSKLTAIGTDIVITGDSGYGSYADIVIRNYYYGCNFDVPDFGLIVASGTCGADMGKASIANIGATFYNEL
ncbi:MAG: hypothetical protein HGA22_07565, partial [Clostridiales bacterium]|nr:hypothetical protein [Clostridiales bacterium]